MLGQDRTLIKGTVTDALTGEPLTGATVYVKDESVNATAVKNSILDLRRIRKPFREP